MILPFEKKHMKNVLSSLAICMLLSSAAFAQKEEFGWLIGTWKLKEKNIIESWSIDEDGKSLKGVSMKVSGNESTILEETKLISKEGKFYYVADVSGKQGAIDFKISSFDASGFVSENPAHDFPKLIRYRYVKKDDKEFIEAAIEGDGKVIPYYFEKVR